MSRSIGLVALFIMLVALGSMNLTIGATGSEMKLDGARLLRACTKLHKEWIGFCNGYLQAAFDAAGDGVCAPPGVTRNDLFDVVVPRLMRASKHLQQDALPLVATILRAAYPCN